MRLMSSAFITHNPRHTPHEQTLGGSYSRVKAALQKNNMVGGV